MYKVELTEDEIQNLGESRYMRKHKKPYLIFLIAGALITLGCMALFELWGLIPGVIWLIMTVIFSSKQIKEGKLFLEEVKNGKNQS